MRLQKFLAEAGVGSRRKCEDLIRQGRVTVDGAVAVIGMQIDPARQKVAVDGKPVEAEPKEYWLLNKPAGVISAVRDPRGRPTVVDLVPSKVRLFPVGRLDLNSTGLILLTNDGELASLLLHPRYHVPKEYQVTVQGTLSSDALDQLRAGVELEEGRTAPAKIVVLGTKSDRRGMTLTDLQITLHEGRKRQIRRMMQCVGARVVSLHRTRIDGLTDKGLAPGQYRPLTSEEVESLRRAALGRRV